MVVLRCTRKLLGKIKSAQIATPMGRESSGVLGDWYCHYVQHGRSHLILCVCECSLLPIIIPAAPIRDLPTRLPEALKRILLRMDIAPAAVEHEIAEMFPVVFAATASRVVLGSLNDFNQALPFYPAEIHAGNLDWLSLHLAETPCKPLGYKAPLQVVLERFTHSRPIS